MTIDQLRKAIRHEPFMPFSICLADGRELPVTHTECIMISPDAARTFGVALAGEEYKIVDLLLVTSLDFTNGQSKSKRREG